MTALSSGLAVFTISMCHVCEDGNERNKNMLCQKAVQSETTTSYFYCALEFLRQKKKPFPQTVTICSIQNYSEFL
jgi:hypothetical protein